MKNNELEYDIIACYWPKENITIHILTCKSERQKFLSSNILIDYGVKFHKVLPKYEIPTYEKSIYMPNSNTLYMVLVSKGNPFGLKKNNKNVIVTKIH